MLIAQVALRQDRDAFKSLFQYFGPRVKSVMLRAGADHEFAEDLVQEVMMTVWRKARLYAPERGPVSTWIYTIARNARIDRLRRASSQPYLDLDEIELASGMADGEDRAFASQRAEHVARALDELPDEQRRIIEYAYVHDMAQSEIAAKLELPLGTVKSRMRLAYTKLKGKLEVLK
ncbi:RNA polymerase sigma-70 factor (ECF subfamily) [Breoghania corrubedonensis]|uniref:RNA polymerase sigma factor n=2 Tax=Breoghania corrubedonensis TaxID=665038 RepID=A0A2T5US36_9HYPH|nr:RNA polymerase sigma-70 factor (ECF subfamily) [Breoghania corrubedonensis]